MAVYSLHGRALLVSGLFLWSRPLGKVCRELKCLKGFRKRPGLAFCCCCLAAQLCLTPCDLMDCRLAWQSPFKVITSVGVSAPLYGPAVPYGIWGKQASCSSLAKQSRSWPPQSCCGSAWIMRPSAWYSAAHSMSEKSSHPLGLESCY